MKQMGFGFRAMYRARESVGATKARIGGWREHGATYYALPENPTPRPMRHGEGRLLRVRRLWAARAMSARRPLAPTPIVTSGQQFGIWSGR